jgi:FkbM family methyltransferase
MYTIPGDGLTEYLGKVHRFYEIDLLSAIRRYERHGVYVDVGAHIGNHSIFFGEQCGATQVVAFEPNPIAWVALARNAERYQKIDAHHCAIHDELEAVEVVDETPGNHGMAWIKPGDQVRAATLDSFRLQNVAVLKVDVEGAEIHVLRSGRDTIWRDRPIIAAEAHTDERRDELDAFLSPLGYRIEGCYGSTPTYLWEPSSS